MAVVNKRTRLVAFGCAVALIAAGILGVVLIGGETGQLLALVLIWLGFVLATSLVFLEVGLSEDRELRVSASAERRRQSARPRRARPAVRARAGCAAAVDGCRQLR